ncbi:MAG: hypothetical protein BGO43_12005 [Gammaproteobacteria bacterium 39-13]|nr:hypothetical protein [Gammaproteobacteria bacterium]OJV85341.1 MAG: hypothetical protein BGO43_12005 [Gammaproteobacteria bacterium 39-13]
MLLFSDKASKEDASTSAPRQIDLTATYAIASGMRNNCGLHSIAHTWLSLPVEKIRQLFETYPIFNRLMLRFYQYHELAGEPNLTDFLLLNKIFSHPWDRELLWGQVLREELRSMLLATDEGEEFGVDDLYDLLDDTYIGQDLLHVLTRKMGAMLTVCNPIYPDVDPVMHFPPEHDEIPSWEIHLYHLGNHFNFDYPTQVENEQHNDRRKKAKALLGAVLEFKKESGLYDYEKQSVSIKANMRLVEKKALPALKAKAQEQESRKSKLQGP